MFEGSFVYAQCRGVIIGEFFNSFMGEMVGLDVSGRALLGVLRVRVLWQHRPLAMIDEGLFIFNKCIQYSSGSAGAASARADIAGAAPAAGLAFHVILLGENG